MVETSRTLNPLPFEHLEPRRFEDLVRQLAYDFRDWRQLEATGRSGGDEGYDIRGWEISTKAEPDSDNDDPVKETPLDRRWLIQCKREKAFGPKKMQTHLDSLSKEELDGLYGIIFAISSNVSKKTRDVLRKKCRESGVSECYVWSVAELEDMLFQPKNDGLLFAYFGISIRIKKRSQKSRIRSRLSTKRKVTSILEEGLGNEEVLILDPDERKYPYLDDELDRREHLWQLARYDGQHPWGVRLITTSYFAYLNIDGKKWDIANKFNNLVNPHMNPWARESDIELRSELWRYWLDKIEEEERGKFEYEVLVDYDDILDIDKDGDECFRNPHIYVPFRSGEPPIIQANASIKVPPIHEDRDGSFVQAKPGRELYLSEFEKNRVKKFPKKYRKN